MEPMSLESSRALQSCKDETAEQPSSMATGASSGSQSVTVISKEMTIRQLRAEAQKLNLVVRGTKKEIWERLKNHLGLSDDEEEEGETGESDPDFDDDPIMEHEGDDSEFELDPSAAGDESHHNAKVRHLQQFVIDGPRQLRVPDRYSPDAVSSPIDCDSYSDDISLDSHISVESGDSEQARRDIKARNLEQKGLEPI